VVYEELLSDPNDPNSPDDPNWAMAESCEGGGTPHNPEIREWAFGEPAGGGGESMGGPDPNSGYTGNHVYGFNITASGDYCKRMDTPSILTSSAYDCTGLSAVSLRFQRWLGVGWAPFHNAAVLVSINGGEDWTTVWENSAEITDYAWMPVEIDISQLADDEEQVQLRWMLGPCEPPRETIYEEPVYCGWNIDDIQLLAFLTDCNENGIQDVQDIANCDPNDPDCQDCNENKVPDECDIANETSQDTNQNGIPDECE